MQQRVRVHHIQGHHVGFYTIQQFVDMTIQDHHAERIMTRQYAVTTTQQTHVD